MAVQNDTSRVQYVGNNSTKNSYAIPFPFFENGHIRCVVTNAAGADSELVLGSGFTVTGAGDENGGSLKTTSAVDQTSKVTIWRDVPLTQTTSYEEGGPFPSDSHERALDKLTMGLQQMWTVLKRTLRVSASAGETVELSTIQGANKLIGTDAAGTLGIYDRTTVSVGQTSTGQAGTNASVTNTGTPQNLVLNFTIPQGIQGIQGVQGIQGLTGPQGGLLNWRGNWSNATSYSINDVVNHNGSLYFATASNTNVDPTNTSHWQPAGTELPTISKVDSRYAATDRMFRTRARWTGNLNPSNANDQLRIVRFGDSYAYDLGDWLKEQLGDGGTLFWPIDTELTGGASNVSQIVNGVAATDSYSSTFLYVSLPSTGTATFRYQPWDWTPPLARHIDVYYVARNGGGTFKVQVDKKANGNFVDVPGATINTNNSGADTITRFTYNYGVDGIAAYRVRCVGVSGTSRILMAGTRQEVYGDSRRPNGCVNMNISMGGTTPPQWDTVSQANYIALLQAFDPHIIFVCCAETLSDLQNHWPSVYSKLRAAAPNADFVIFGSHPTSNETDTNYLDPTDEYFRSWCDSNDEDFIDCRHLFIPYQQTDSVGKAIYADGVHLATAGYKIMQAAGASRLKWLANAMTRSGRLPASPRRIDLIDVSSNVSGPIVWMQDGSDIGLYGYAGGRGFGVTRNTAGDPRIGFFGQGGTTETNLLVGGGGIVAGGQFGALGSMTVAANSNFPRASIEALRFYGPALVTSVTSNALGPQHIQQWRFGTSDTNPGTNVAIMHNTGELGLAQALRLNRSSTTPTCGRVQLSGGRAYVDHASMQNGAQTGTWSCQLTYEGNVNAANAGILSFSMSSSEPAGGTNSANPGVFIQSTNANDNHWVHFVLYRRHNNDPST